MPSMENTSKLSELLGSFQQARTMRDKSELLSKAKRVILNEMSDDQIRSFFVDSTINFEALFQIDVWTDNLEEKNGMAEFTEPYDIVEHVFGQFDNLSDMLELFHDQLVFLLKQNKDEKVKHMFVKRLTKLTSQNVQRIDVLKFELRQFLPLLLDQIPNTTVSYSQLLTDFVTSLARHVDKLDASFTTTLFADQSLLSEIDRIAEINATQAFRVMELIVKLACVSEKHLTEISEAKLRLSARINTYLDSQLPDILAQLNCIELLSELANTPHGYAYIVKTGHLSNLVLSLSDKGSNPFASFLQPALVKLFSGLARINPVEVQQSFSVFYSFIFNLVSSEDLVNDLASINLAVETFSFLFESNLVKKFFYDNYQASLIQLFDRLVSDLKRSINDKLRENIIMCISHIACVDSSLLVLADQSDVKLAESQFNKPEWIELSKQMYEKLVREIKHESLFNICLSLAKKPFLELRIASQAYFRALAQTKWGIEMLFTPNRYNSGEQFIDGYLLNRTIEIEKQGLESKYELNKVLVLNFDTNPSLVGLIGVEALDKLKLYVSDGPFYSKAQSRVAFENE